MENFKLDKGIFFEDSNRIIPWEETFENLSKVDNPEISNDGLTLRWNGKQCFNNHQLDVIATSNQYQNNNQKLESLTFEEQNETADSIYKTAERFSSLFRNQFGEASEKKLSYGRLVESWEVDDVKITIGIGERFTDFLIFTVHKIK